MNLGQQLAIGSDNKVATAPPFDGPLFTITITDTLYYIEGQLATGGGQSVRPVRMLTPGTHTLQMTLFVAPGESQQGFITLILGYLDAVNEFNDNGNQSSPTHGIQFIYEEDDAPGVWQCTSIDADQFGLIQTTNFHDTAAATIASGHLPLTAFTAQNIPSP